MATVLADPALYDYIGGQSPTLEELTRHYAVQTRGRSSDGREVWVNQVVTLGAEQQPIGYVQATIPVDGGPTEVAWVIGVPWQGRGHATRAAALLDSYLAERGVTELVAHVHPEHAASQYVARSLGMEPTDAVVEGEVRWVRSTETTIPVAPGLRLRRFDPNQADAALLDQLLDIYADAETVRMVDGPDASPYTMDKLLRMYRHLHSLGELYLVERHDGRNWTPIGDATLSASMIPIVIDRRARRQGTGRQVLAALVERARHLGWTQMKVSDIYDDNAASIALYSALGFRPTGTTRHGRSYELTL